MIYDSMATALKECSRHRVLVVEGHRCSGKDYFIQSLLESNPEFLHYEIFKPRKRHKTLDGSLQLPDALNIRQGHYWCLDVIKQIVNQDPKLKVVLNRSLISNFAFEGEDPKIKKHWITALQECGGHIIMIRPSDDDAMERIQKAGRQSEVVSIFKERSAMDRIFEEFDDDLKSTLR